MTPPESYIYLPSFRQNMIHAHHVTHLQNEGNIGAKNLLILCKFHHEYIGDKLSNESVKVAVATAPTVLRRFPTVDFHPELTHFG